MVVDPQAWDEQIRALRSALLNLADATPVNAVPVVGSVAMAELTREPEFRVEGAGRGWGTDPVHRCHTMASQFMGLAVDAARAMATVAVGENQIAYSIIILLRPVLEGCGRAHQIHTAQDLRTRLALSYNEYLTDIHYQRRSADEEMAKKAQTRYEEVLRAADRLGFEMTKGRKGRPKQLLPERTPNSEVIRRVLAPTLEPEVGSMLNQYVSSVTHGGTLGMYSLLEADERPGSTLSIYDGASVLLSASLTNALLAAAGHALVTASRSRIEFFGMEPDDRWSRAFDQYSKTVVALAT